MKSALAFAALTSRDAQTEHELYESIVSIPHYHTSKLKLLDREDEWGVVEDNFTGF